MDLVPAAAAAGLLFVPGFDVLSFFLHADGPAAGDGRRFGYDYRSLPWQGWRGYRRRAATWIAPFGAAGPAAACRNHRRSLHQRAVRLRLRTCAFHGRAVPFNHHRLRRRGVLLDRFAKGIKGIARIHRDLHPVFRPGCRNPLFHAGSQLLQPVPGDVSGTDLR